jgi:hypothetical protein
MRNNSRAPANRSTPSRVFALLLSVGLMLPSQRVFAGYRIGAGAASKDVGGGGGGGDF